MKKIARIDLAGVPWPVNLLQCCRHTGEMQPGDAMVISVTDEDVKDSLLLILNASPELSVDVSELGQRFAINITKNKAGV